MCLVRDGADCKDWRRRAGRAWIPRENWKENAGCIGAAINESGDVMLVLAAGAICNGWIRTKAMRMPGSTQRMASLQLMGSGQYFTRRNTVHVIEYNLRLAVRYCSVSHIYSFRTYMRTLQHTKL